MAVPRYHQRAKADLQAIWRYLATRNPAAADRYLRELQERAFTYAAMPTAGRLEPEVAERLKLPSDITLRSFLYRNHRSYYFSIDVGIMILRVLPTRRDRNTALEE